MGKETMKKEKVDRVSMKDERGITTAFAIFSVIGVIVVLVFILVTDPFACDDCSDIVGHGDSSDPRDAPYWEMRDKEDYLRIGYMPGYCMGQSREQNVCAIVQWWDDNGVKHNDRIGGMDSSDAIAKLDDIIETFGMSESQERDSHHIIDCIQRGCK